jgi:AraC family transcriptional regulator, transcriptional activator of pobA
VEGKPVTLPYKRRDFYKIMLVAGNSKVHYADKTFEVQQQALSFSNPQILYKWEHLDTIRNGMYCIFNQYINRATCSNTNCFNPMAHICLS